jgi:hypothetical protein
MTQDRGLSQTLEGVLCLLCDGDVEDIIYPWCGCDGSERNPHAFWEKGGQSFLPRLRL